MVFFISICAFGLIRQMDFQSYQQIEFCETGVARSAIFVVPYLTIWLNRSYLYTHQLAYMPILYVSTFSSFAIGAIFVKYDIAGQLRERIPIRSIGSNILAILIFILLLALRAMCPML